MVEITASTASLARDGDTVMIKSDSPSQDEQAESSANARKVPNRPRPRKRRRQSTKQYIDIDSDDEGLEQPVKVEGLDEGRVIEENQLAARVKKVPLSPYQETCQRYKTDSKSLPDPKHASPNALPELYKRSFDLKIFMMQKYEDKHLELIKVKKQKALSNAKITSQKRTLTETKELLQKANMRAEVAENNFKDANLQLTLKVARPLSQAQVKLENVQEDYANEMNDLHALLAQKEADRTAAEEARVAAEANLEKLRATGTSQTSDPIMQTSAMHNNLDDPRRLREIAESSVNELTATNIRLRADVEILEAKVSDLAKQIATADADFATEKGFLVGENESLKADNQKLEQRVIKQKAMLDSMVNAV